MTHDEQLKKHVLEWEAWKDKKGWYWVFRWGAYNNIKTYETKKSAELYQQFLNDTKPPSKNKPDILL